VSPHLTATVESSSGKKRLKREDNHSSSIWHQYLVLAGVCLYGLTHLHGVMLSYRGNFTFTFMNLI
jgi:hypothetical protein